MVVSLIECGSIFRALEFGFLVNVLKAEDFVCVYVHVCVHGDVLSLSLCILTTSDWTVKYLW